MQERNALKFLYIVFGIIIVMVQGYFIGHWSRKFGDRWLIRVGLLVLAAGLLLTGVTPTRPVPWYSRAELQQELSGESGTRNLPSETPPTQNINISLPEETNKSLLGFAWLLVAMIPAAIGGGVMQPAVNSLLTRSVPASMLSGANAFAPVIGGALFQTLGPRYPYWIGGLVLMIAWLFVKKEFKQGTTLP